MPRDRRIAAVTVGHLAIDIFNSMGPVLATFLVQPLGLSAAQVGLAVGLYGFLAGATQPLFGFVVDRIGSRILGPLSLFCTITSVCLALALALESRSFGWFLLPFAFAALGSGAFHPQGAMHAASARRAATSTAVFFLFGQVGLASGPLLAGVLLDRFGPRGIYALGALILPAAVGFMIYALGSRRRNPPPERLAAIERSVSETRSNQLARILPLLILVFACRGWVFIGTAGFLPLLFQGRGATVTVQGLVTGLFWLGGAITGVLAGSLADRFGRRPGVFASTFAGALLLPVLPIAPGATALLAAVACGAALGAPHSVLMVMAQDLLPVRRGLSSGAALGFLFASGALASWAIGACADRFGLVPVLQAGCVIGLVGAAASLALPAARREVGTAGGEAAAATR